MAPSESRSDRASDVVAVVFVVVAGAELAVVASFAGIVPADRGMLRLGCIII